MTVQEIKTEYGITNADILDALSERFPKISKSTLSMAGNTEDYGVCLCPEAERILKKKFGRPSFWEVFK